VPTKNASRPIVISREVIHEPQNLYRDPRQRFVDYTIIDLSNTASTKICNKRYGDLGAANQILMLNDQHILIPEYPFIYANKEVMVCIAILKKPLIRKPTFIFQRPPLLDVLLVN